MIRDKKFKIGLVLTFVLMTILCCTLLCTPLVFADYSDLNGSEVLSFNQQVVNQYTHGDYSSGQWIDLSTNVISGHDYYIKVICSSVGALNGFFFSYANHDENTLQQIFLVNSIGTYDTKINASRTNFCTYTNSAMSIDGCMLIDLTQMFGSGNEPNLEQCRELFVSDYYQYTAGTPLSYDTIQAYNNGVNAYASSTSITIATGNFINSVYAVNLDNDYIGYGTNNGVNWSVLQKTSDSVILSEVYAPISTICLPFNTTLRAGTQITISGYIYDGAYNQVHNIGVGYWVNGGMVEMGIMTGYTGSPVRYKENTITFTIPIDLDRIYIYCGLDGQNVNLRDFSVSYYITDFDLLRSTTYEQGYNSAKDYYSASGVGGQLIYQQGYTAGVNSANEYTFSSLMFSVIDAPLQAVLNIFNFDFLGFNLKNFITVVLTLCLILCIVNLFVGGK